jgi:exopolyphosphatase/pppGpp-phosphohydrolase
MIQKIKTASNREILDTTKIAAVRVAQNAINEGLITKSLVLKVVTPSINSMSSSSRNNHGINQARHTATAKIAALVTAALNQKFKSPHKIIKKIVICAYKDIYHRLCKTTVLGCMKAQMFADIEINETMLIVHKTRNQDKKGGVS